MGKLYVESLREGPVSVHLKNKDEVNPYKTVHLYKGLNAMNQADWDIAKAHPTIAGLMADGMIKESDLKPKSQNVRQEKAAAKAAGKKLAQPSAPKPKSEDEEE